MDSVEVRVARGADWLDKVFPEWFRRIDVGLLAVNNPCRCVLAQAIDRDMGYMWMSYLAATTVGDRPWIKEHGFCGGLLCEFDPLDEAWIAQIKSRWERGL